MNRKQALGIVVVMTSATVVGLIAIATIPVWLTALMIKPSLANPVAEKITGTISANVMRSMMRNSIKQAKAA